VLKNGVAFQITPNPEPQVIKNLLSGGLSKKINAQQYTAGSFICFLKGMNKSKEMNMNIMQNDCMLITCERRTR